MESNKKYCFFSSMPKKEREVILYRQSNSLIANGWSVYNVVSGIANDEVDRGVIFRSTGYHPSNIFMRMVRGSRKLYKKLLEIDADIYHTVHVDQLPTCLRLKKMGKRVVFEMQEDHPYSLYWKTRLPQWLLKPVVFFMEKWMGYYLRQLDLITTVSYDQVEWLKQWGCNPERILVLGNFPEVQKDYILTKEDYLNRDNRMIYFGLIYSYSRQEVILKALQQLPNVKYLVAGLFMSNENQTYRQAILNNPIWRDRVEFVEGFKPQELDDFIKKSTISNVVRDFSVYRMMKLGSFGIIKIFESMERALPIICADMPVYREIMEIYKCGILVDPNNPQQIADAIKYLVEHKEEAWKMGQEGRKAVLEKYSWDAASVIYLKSINALLA